MPSVVAEIVVALLILCTGACNSIVSKLLYQTDGKTFDGTIKYFEKPWLLTAVMFLGEFFCLIIYGISWLIFRCTKKEEEEENSLDSMSQEEDPKNDKIIFIAREDVEGDPTSGLKWKYPLYVLLFAACDLISTTMMSIGLVYCNASVIQIIRGMVIVFTLLFSWAFLGRKPNLFHVTGVLFALVGLVLVGVSAVMSDDSGTTKFQGKSLLGIGLTLISQIFSAIQFTFEEKLLKGINIPPLFLVGSEGLAGFILCCAIALPAANAIHGNDYGVQEYFKSTIYMTFHIPQVTALVFTSAIAVCILNWTSFVYVKYLSAVARTLVNACRTILVWIIMVILYYASKHTYGEAVNYWSILQAAGFILMMVGTTAHNNIAGFGERIIRITCCCFLDENQAEQKIDDEEKKLDSSASSEEKKDSTVSNESEEKQEV
ncbi:hypothetical protein TVAG_005580 [Trichomonas vaginalis G3]|uniref:EamA domain-containing protein n=1 Tax=Trichomonas vaginalis (strain ATCC PRA-98 / G3) TaxID=412133 RepID=A2ENT8_TRIV3|nr:negative regulation of mitochondrial outer membrane permeabilization protein [Trichomonas vaginalis G3]EAY05714.1 hypothetical protein TVAG_005580 [Trichomonas vaginalis G3]KAI5506894.1 negative regulation of mitochondrial outer membrane permeabilization protein [Trichomonas vaginalis G3]|eukprot:XP_001317937.1 hypothetical protein [Trichomonas vaginalis G3]